MAKVNIYKKYKGTQIPLIVEKDEDGFYVVECPLFDGCYTQGKTIDEALKNIREVLSLVLQEESNQKILDRRGTKELSLHAITL